LNNELKSDEIFIEGLECFTVIGINDWEKKTKQLVIIDVSIFILQVPNKNKDLITETIDYKNLSYKIKSFVEESDFDLIETLAKEIALLCLKVEKVVKATIKVNKPNALKISKNVGVIVSRERKK
jgi:dihydroneopterin aldolase|tara:strand:+ start:1579 stop:1953 length:375 start_codon:yes stop_codon:yes gene_type:complete